MASLALASRHQRVGPLGQDQSSEAVAEQVAALIQNALATAAQLRCPALADQWPAALALLEVWQLSSGERD